MIDIKFTIITVCYNAEMNIEETIRSVIGQQYSNFQYIIKDGNSTDKTMEIVEYLSVGNPNIQVISSKDNGIYDAMNQAVEYAEGEYIFFLNAGDIFYDDIILKKVNQYLSKEKKDIVYGDIIEIEEGKARRRVYTQKNSKLWHYSLGACICHQGMFCKREMFQKKIFDTHYQVCADREWQLYYLKNGVSTRCIDMIIAKVLVDGFSKRNIGLLEQETAECIKKYCGIGYWIFCSIVFIKKSRIMHTLITKVEKLISCKRE